MAGIVPALKYLTHEASHVTKRALEYIRSPVVQGIRYVADVGELPCATKFDPSVAKTVLRVCDARAFLAGDWVARDYDHPGAWEARTPLLRVARLRVHCDFCSVALDEALAAAVPHLARGDAEQYERFRFMFRDRRFRRLVEAASSERSTN